MRNDLQHDLCTGCGEWHDMSMGLIPFVNKTGCTANVVVYRPFHFSIRKFHNILSGKDEMSDFKNLLNFTHLKKMPDLDTATELDKKIYSICRDSDLRSLKRMRDYIYLEQEYYDNYF